MMKWDKEILEVDCSTAANALTDISYMPLKLNPPKQNMKHIWTFYHKNPAKHREKYYQNN